MTLKVSPNAVHEMMESVTFQHWLVPGTTTTVVAAVMADGFVLATGTSGCIDPSGFDAELGVKIATDNARVAAFDKCWELLGWELKMSMTNSGYG